MSETPATEEKKIRPWQWPGQWVRDESFWRDVASRTASGVLVVALVYVFGLATGYFSTPTVVAQTLAYIGMGGLLLTQTVFLALTFVRSKTASKFEPTLKKFRWVVVVSALATLASMIIMSMTGQVNYDPAQVEDPLFPF